MKHEEIYKAIVTESNLVRSSEKSNYKLYSKTFTVKDGDVLRLYDILRKEKQFKGDVFFNNNGKAFNGSQRVISNYYEFKNFDLNIVTYSPATPWAKKLNFMKLEIYTDYI